MFATLYRGETISRKGNRIKVEICDSQYPGNTAPAVGELRFPADEPISIEWSSDKLDTIIGSTCTVTIVSPGDRTYIDLYQVEVGRIWLKLSYKAYGSNSWKTIWQGSLDTEFYEEPYSRNKDYDVTLTFSDFGMLQRLTYNLEGVQTLRSIITTALSLMSPQSIYTLNDSYISTKCYQSNQHILTELQVRSDNFTDEDGVSSSWYDVLEGVLKPLALRIEQRAGTIYIYDVNALINGNGTGTAIGTEEVYWSADDATLSVDETANKVIVTFSQYAESKLFDGDKCVFDADKTGIVYKNGYYQVSSQDMYDSFELQLSPTNKVVPGIAEHGYLFKTKAIEDGPDTQGVIGFIGGVNYANPGTREEEYIYDNTQWNRYIGVAPTVPTAMSGRVLYKTERFMLPGSGLWNAMRISIPMLADGKFNPFAGEDDDHNRLHSDFKNYANAVYLRVEVKVYSAKTGGTLLATYLNWPYTSRSYETARTKIWGEPSAGWKTTSPSSPTLIEYCRINGDIVDAKDCGTIGSMNNGHEAFNSSNKVNKAFSGMNAMHVPIYAANNQDAWCEITVYDELYIYDQGDTFRADTLVSGVKSGVYQRINWFLVGFPTVEVVKLENEAWDTYDVPDIEESGIINPLAQDEVSVSTICGSANDETARGGYKRSRSNQTKFTRQSRTATSEQLLIGSIYSQYADRHLKLSGSANAVVPTSGLKLLTDANTTGKKYLITEETYNVLADESEIVLTEASGDNYTAS